MKLQTINKKVRLSRFAMAMLMLSAFLFLMSCAKSSEEIAENVGGITANQIIENPSAYVGKTVTVSGDVEEIWGPRAFNMDSGASIGELLVVGREPFPNLADAGDRAYVINDVATVTGVVRMFVTADVEREIGWDLDPQIESEFSGKPVLVVQKANFRPNANSKATTGANPNADQANLSEMSANNGQRMEGGNLNQTMGTNNSGLMTGTANSNQTAGTNNSNQTMTGNKVTDASAYGAAADKLSFAGRAGQFSNLRVVRVAGPRTFTVASGKGEIYVMLDDESARGVGTQGKIDPGDTLNVSGRFERLDMAEISDIASNRFRALTPTERAFLKETPVYFQSDKVSKLK